MKSIKLSEHTWNKLRNQLHIDHGVTFLLIRNKPLKTYGFTVRFHRNFNEHKRYYEAFYYLDVFDEEKIIWFLLKYGDFL